MGVGRAKAINLALAIHELASSSMKYGELSTPPGTHERSTATDDGAIVLTWLESEGTSGVGT